MSVKKIRLKIVSCVLAILMSVSLLAGCSDNTKNTQADENSSIENSEQQGQAGQNTQEKAKFTIISVSTKFPEDPNNSWNNKQLEERFNVDLEWIAGPEYTQYPTKLNTMAAAGDLPDVIVDPSYEFMTQGLLLPLDDLLNKYGQNVFNSMPPEAAKQIWPGCKYNGETYIIPTYVQPDANALYIRKDWLEKLGLQVPKTLDEFHDMAKAFTFNDPDGNGQNDTYGISERNMYGGAFFSYITGAYGVVPFFWMDRNGKLEYGATLPETKEALKTLQAWYKEGIIDPEFITTPTNQWQDKIANGKVGVFLAGVYSRTRFSDMIKKANPKGEIMWIEPPVAPDGKKGMHQWGWHGRVSVGFNKNIKHPERMMQIIDWMSTDEGFELTTFGIKGQHWQPDEQEGVKMLISEEEQKKLGVGDAQGAIGMFFNLRWSQREKDLGAKDREGLNLYKASAIYPEGGLPVVLPPDSPAVKQNIATDLDKLNLETLLGIVAGKLPIDAWDDYVAEWRKRGGDLLTQEMNKVYQQLKQSAQ